MLQCSYTMSKENDIMHRVNDSHKSEVIRARIDPALKASTESIFHELGLTTSQAITLFLKQVELRHGLPFSVNIPNKQTAKALQDSEAGIDIIEAQDMDDLLQKLGLDDKK